MGEADIDALLRGNSPRRRWLLLASAAVVVAVAAVVAFLLLRPDGSVVVIEPQRAEAVMGQLSTDVELYGAALSERSATLSFDVAGVVASVAVAEGDEVRTGDALATLDAADAQRRVETADVQLRLAQLRLDNLLAGPEESAVASANQAIASAKAQVLAAELAVVRLLEPANTADLASAEQAVASALGQLSSAEEALALLLESAGVGDLSSARQAVASALGQLSNAEQALALLLEPPNAADLASAEQAVASALGQLSSTEQVLALLLEPPNAADLASAEQAVASALGQLSSTEQVLAELLAGPSEAELSGARSAVAQAQVQLASARTHAEESIEALTEAFDTFCERYGGLSASDAVIRGTCTTTLPLSDAQVDALRDSFEDRSTTYESYGNALIDANIIYVESDADRDSADSGLASAEESLSELSRPAPEDDLYQAEQAAEAARAGHTAAVARLEDLRAPGEEDVYQAEQAVEAARAGHAAAVARLEDLRVPGEEDVYQAEQAVEAARAGYAAAVAGLDELQAVPGEDDVYQAEQAIEAARASHAAAVARFEDLRAAVDDREIEQARATLESAQASLAGARAHYNELVAGAAENEVEQQRQDVRLAELAVEEAHAALAGFMVVAPFDGVVEAVGVRPGDRIASGFAAFNLSTPSRMLVALTVTEEDLLDLEVGQAGLASFDAIDGVEYPLRVVSISRVPNAEQGVVTYDVEARILTGLGGANAADNRSASGFGTGGGFGQGGGFGGQAARDLLARLELPEGVTIQQLMQAVANGEPLPEGVVLPEGLEDAAQAFGQFAAGRRQGQGAQQAPQGQQGPAGQPSATADRPMPAPGMSASVTIITEVREAAVLAPVSAVRQLDGAWFVSVPAPSEVEDEDGFERVFVEVGESDGTSVEILSGIDSGTVLLIGADNAGIAFSATFQQPQANPGFGPGQGGFGPGGGGGRP